MNKKLLSLLVTLSILITGCSAQASEMQVAPIEEVPTKEVRVVEVSTYLPQTYTYEIYGETYEVTYGSAPKRAITMSQFMTEMLLALDLGDSMVGTAYMDNAIYPEFADAYNTIPVLSDKYPSKEVMYSVEPDFVSGWTSVFNEKRVASASEMMENGIHPFLAKSISGEGALESVYEDFLTLGKIFDVTEKAESLVGEMKAEVSSIQNKIGQLEASERVRIFAYDSGENEPFVVAGGGISGDLIKQAQGENIFSDIQKGYATVSWEEVVARDPEVIVIVDYGDTSAQTKMNFIQTHPAMQDVTAVKNDRFVVIGLADMSPGVRNTAAIKQLAQGFYSDRFE